MILDKENEATEGNIGRGQMSPSDSKKRQETTSYQIALEAFL